MLQFPESTDWFDVLRSELESDYYAQIDKAYTLAINDCKSIYPSLDKIFVAFELTSFADTKVVILGQDPYHQAGQAMGLSFSVPDDVKIPPSLKNIFKELSQNFQSDMPTSGNLVKWAEQGVLLLNSTLTVEDSAPNSHSSWAWSKLTDATIKALSDQKENIVFMLWGNFAKQKEVLINSEKHLILQSAHPSPLARNKFMGNQHFLKCNNYLASKGLNTIHWPL